MARAAMPKINVTKNYRMFKLADDNRKLNLPKHRKLRQSMQENGFFPWMPVICVRDKGNNLVVRDGQHRLAFAETLGLEVYWVEVSESFDIAQFNGTAVVWNIRDYAETFAKNGKASYVALLEFSERHGIGVAISALLLGGTQTFANIAPAFYAGDFKIKEQHLAESVAEVYVTIVATDKRLKTQRLLEALVAAARVDGFNSRRLLKNLSGCNDKLKQYSTRDGFLEMLEDIYNFRQQTLVPLKINAIQAMRERNPALKAKIAKEKKRA